MRKVKRFCDRCGREVVEGERSYQLCTFIYTNDADNADDVETGAELCQMCFETVDKATLAAIKREEPKPETQPEPQPKTIKLDLGKVKALHEAGWSGKDIAIEMRVSGATISKALKKIYAEEGGNEQVHD